MSPHRSVRVRILIALIVLVPLLWLASLAAVLVWEHNDQTKPVGAIVVLGAAQYDGKPSPVLKARLDHAIALWKLGIAPALIVTGGRGTGDTTSEAAVSRKYVMQRGVPDAAILLESEGRTTSQSIAGVAAIMAARHRRDVLLVSDPFHMFRLAIVARRHGLDASTSPTPTSPITASPAERWKYALSESLKAPFTFIFERGAGAN